MILSGNKAIARDYIEGLNMLSTCAFVPSVPAQASCPDSTWRPSECHDYIIPGGTYEQRVYL